jgi:hypothetical protein
VEDGRRKDSGSLVLSVLEGLVFFSPVLVKCPQPAIVQNGLLRIVLEVWLPSPLK